MDPTSGGALDVLQQAQAAHNTLYGTIAVNEAEEDSQLKVDEAQEDLEVFSDSEDARHEGNGTPCKLYNRKTCEERGKCHFSHKPDKLSVRDELFVIFLSTWV